MPRERKNYVANVIGWDTLLDASALAQDRPDARPIRSGDDGVCILYGDAEGGTVVVAAYDENDAERRIRATFSDGEIDDLQESVDQRPLSVAYTAGLVPEGVYGLLRLDTQARPYLEEQIKETEFLIEAMPDEKKAEYRESGPYRALASLDALLAEALAAFARPDGPKRVRYLDVRFDVSDLSEAELDALVGEVTVQAEASDDHPTVEVEVEVTPERVLCAHCEKEIEDDGSALCDSCETQAHYDAAS